MKQFLYIVTAGNQSIEVWELSYTGEMYLIQVIDTAGNEGQPIIISKTRNKLYIGIRPQYQILVYDILPNGILNKIGSQNIPYSPNYLTFDQNENFLFCSYYHDGCLSISKIDQKHIPTAPIQIIEHIKGCHSVKLNLSQKLVIVPSLLNNRIYLFQLLKHAVLPLKFLKYITCSIQSGPRHIIFHNKKDYCYSINELNGTIDVWKINNDKNNIQNIQNINLLNKKINNNSFWSADIHMTSCGKYLYASDRMYSTITIFKVNINYTLSYISQINTVKQPKSFLINHDNQYLIVVGQQDNTIAVYNISMENGLLYLLYKYPTGINPTWIISYAI
ncbi:beta-propeller fold lactonase family protein [Buchnera aphidicola (Takecallis taiwana)]|uniref:beta-propeller fold lactonase family protein n=1 Tax=Buchnera aphidicola TaxID=9 RepID=UPI0031B6B79D